MDKVTRHGVAIDRAKVRKNPYLCAMIYQLNDDDCFFPPASHANRDGLLAFGGDLSPQRLIVAYANGIFPWYTEDDPILWWSLDPRLVIRPGEMKVSKSLRHTLKTRKFEVRIDTNFREVMLHCAETPREGQDGTWILDEMVEAYCHLHELGIAHSFETYLEDKLVGGLYGVSIGKVFFGESMFHTVSDASKIAFYHLHQFLINNGFQLIDCQQVTSHLMSLGAYAIPRSEFLNELKTLTREATLVGNWGGKECEAMYLRIEQPETVKFRSYS
jgi:leucyl/phenylalanyl-tRNA--protein transferase